MSTPASTTTAPTVEVVDPDYPVTPVPRHARKSFVSLAVVLLGFTVFTPTMLAGAQLGAAFSLSELVQVILLGSLVLGVYVAVLGFIGARTGLTTVVMSRYVLGQRGAVAFLRERTADNQQRRAFGKLRGTLEPRQPGQGGHPHVVREFF